MIVKMKVANAEIRTNDLELFETQIHLKLPVEYKKFLLTQNGGVPVKGIFQYEGGASGVIFFGLNVEQHNDLRWSYDCYKTRIPVGFLPIGSDPGGNLICIDTNKNVPVYFWDHEKETVPVDRSNVFLIANDFGDFLYSLQEDLGGEDW